MKKLYQAQVTVSGGREGRARSTDGRIDLALGLPKELGGSGAAGTNPEQLFAAGYAACFESALRHVARLRKIAVKEASVTATVDIGALPDGRFALEAALAVSLPELDQETARSLVDAAHQVCPYSNATRGNLDVRLTLV